MTNEIRFLWDIPVPMRDGVRLSADIYLPKGDGPFPAILQRTPYDNTAQLWVGIAMYFAQQGYAFVMQDVRGRCDSEGQFEPFINEAKDGYDTVEWVAAQPWCSGKVGMMGGSYGGFVQWMAARERPPHLTALVSTAAAGRWMHELPYINGKFRPYWMLWLNLVGGRTMQSSTLGLGSAKSPADFGRLYHHRPLRDMDSALGRTNTVWRKWLEHCTYDDYWKQLSLEGYYEQIDLPVLHITGWFDGDQWGEMHYYRNMLRHSPAADKQWLLVGPWDHGGTRVPKASLGGIDFTPDSVVDTNAVHLRFFDYWLKDEDNDQAHDPRVKVFIMGRNEWHEAEEWPLPGTQMTAFYLHSGGKANTLGGDGTLSRSVPADEPVDTYTYNPDHPTPSQPDIYAPPGTEMPLDNRFAERRDDVLVFTSAPLEAEVILAGRAFIKLYAASDCVDTDFMATLCDVYPDGRSVPLTTAVMRASYRDSLEHPTPITPGKVYEYSIEFMETCNAFLPGHCIRVDVMSALHPEYDRNPNTGAPVGDDLEVKLAHQQIYHDAQHPSHILLPVVSPERLSS